MKKFLVILLILPLALALSGCSAPGITKTTPAGNDAGATALPEPGATVLASPTAGATVTPGVNSGNSGATVQSGIPGTWDTNWGNMTFTASGSHVTGVYEHDNGTIEATLAPDGRSMAGWWYEEPTRQPPEDAGRFYLNLSDDGQAFTGSWGYGEKDNDGSWSGTRVKTGTGF